MKRLVYSFWILFCAQTAFAQSADFEAAWEQVYRFELQGLPKSAARKVDSIYRVANIRQDAQNRVKAIIYQSKFLLLTSEQDVSAVVANFKKEIAVNPQPVSNVLESLLAKLYLDYYQQNRWEIRRRTRLEKPEEDFKLWDESTFKKKITAHYEASLQLDEALLNTPIDAFDDLLDREETTRKYRPLLYDLLVHNAIDGFSKLETWEQRNADHDELSISDFLLTPEAFATLDLATRDTSKLLLKTMQAYQKLTRVHQSDTTPYASVLLALERFKVVESKTNSDQIGQLYLKALENLRVPYQNHETSALIDFASAEALQQQSANYPQNPDMQFKAAEAKTICEATIAAFPESTGAKKCQSLLKIILNPSLRIVVEGYVLPGKPSKIKVTYQNYEALLFKTYRMSPSQYSDFDNSGKDSVRNVMISEAVAAKEWTATLKNESDYLEHSTEALFVPHKLGQYLVVVTDPKTPEQILSYAFVQATRLAIVKIQSELQEEYMVVDRENGVPLKDVKATFNRSYYGNRPDKEEHEVSKTTDEQGEIRFANNLLSRRVNITLSLEGDQVIIKDNYIYQQDQANPVKPEEYKAQVHFFTDRTIYRPGQELFFKVILTKQWKERSEIYAGKELWVMLYDTNDEFLDSAKVTTNEFGSVAGEFTLPKRGITGRYYLKVDQEGYGRNVKDEVDEQIYGRHYFRVEEYKRPKFEVSFESVNELYTVNDSVFVSGSATSFAGSNVTDAKVKYQVFRTVDFPNLDWSSRPIYSSAEVLITEGELLTDAEGNFKIPFKAQPNATLKQKDKPVFNYRVSIDVVDINGETHSASTTVRVGYHKYEVTLVTNELDKSEKAPAFQVMVNTLNGTPQNVNGKLRIFKKIAPNYVKREALWPAPEYAGFTRTEHERLFPHLPYQYQDQINLRGELYYDRIVEIRDNEPLVLGGMKNWPQGSYEAEFVITSPSDDATPITKEFEVTDPKAASLADNKLFDLSIDKPWYRAGDKVKVRYGSASKDLYVTIWVEKEGKRVQKFTSHLNNEVKTFEIPVLKSDEGGFGIYYHFTAYNGFESGAEKAEVIYENQSLKLEVGTFRNKLQPGSEEEWTFRIKGKDRKRVTAEVLASMYDASLDQFSANRWAFEPFSRNGYYLRNRASDQRSFATTNFTLARYFYTPSITPLVFEDVKWFGLSVTDVKRTNQNYLRDLRWRNTPKIRIFSSKVKGQEGMISGSIIDEAGLPLVGVSLLVNGQVSGTTDLKGKFKLKGAKGQNLQIRFLGYKTYQLVLGDDNHFEVYMIPEDTDLGEVVVTGYGVQVKRDLTASISTVVIEVADEEEIDEEMFLSVDNGDKVSIRGLNSISASNRPLIVMDRIVVWADSINVDDVASVQRLAGSEAESLYGAQGANGVIIITTKKAREAQNALLAQVKTRQNLKETAFFFPQIKTDRKGRFSFHFKSPESLTKWNLQLMAHDKRLASVISRRTVVTQKELMLLPNAPRFFREGDKITFSAKVASLSAQSQKGFARLELFDELTGKPLTGVISNQTENQNFQLEPRGNANLSWQLSIPEGVQAIRYKVVAATDDFSDGEENVLPVLSNRLLVQESVPLWAAANTTQSFSLDKLKAQESNTLKHHRLTLTLTTNPVWEAIQSLPNLMEYPYECAEQTFARYYANALGSHILEEFPVIQSTFEKWRASGKLVSKLEQNEELKSLLIEETPWLRDAKDEVKQQKRLAMLFESARMKDELKATLDKLRNMQLTSGGFPWFASSSRPNAYITRHIVAGLAHLKKLTGSTEFDDILKKGQGFMDQELIKRHKRIKEIEKKNNRSPWITFSEAQYLYTRSLVSHDEASEELANVITFFEKEAFTHWLQMGLQTQAMIAMYAHSIGNDQKADQIIASLKEYSVTDPEMGTYWKTNVTGWYNWEAPVETQALLIEAFSQIAEEDTLVNGMKQWLLSQKRTKSWKSTKATTEAIYALLLNRADWLQINQELSVTVAGKEVYTSATGENEPGPGYVKKTWLPAEIKPEMAEVKIDNKGNTIAFGGLHWQYFEDLDKITPAMGALSLEKQLFKVTSDSGEEVLKALDENTTLALGDLVRVRIVLRSDRVMEFLHLKDMRAAGFEPVNVLSGYHWQDGLGYYESTRDAATNFFIEYLPKGTFVFQYDLRVNNAGDFSNGITSIQNMYAPEFSSHSEGIRIKIGK